MVVAYPITEACVDRHLRGSSVAAAVGIVVGYYLFRVVMPEALPGYTLATQARNGFGNVDAEVMVTAGVTVFGVTVPASLRRPWGSPLMVALVPFALFGVLGTLPRHQVLALPAVCVAIFWQWPATRRERLLTLAVVPLAIVSAIVYVNGLPDRFRVQHLQSPTRVIESLRLVAVALGVWLWRIHHEPAAQGAATHRREATSGLPIPDPRSQLPRFSGGPE